MKIALVYPPFLKLFGGSMNAVINGLCMLGAVAEKCGHQVIVFNADYDDKVCAMSLYDFQNNHDKYLNSLDNLDLPVWVELKDFMEVFSPDILGITCMTAHWASVKNVADIFKQLFPERPVIVGGHHATAVPNQVLAHKSVDYVVRGEGEYTFTDLLDAIGANKPIETVKGVSFKSGANNIHNVDRELIKDLDELPFAAVNLMYNSNKLSYENEMVFTSRGCPHDCIFCASKLTWTRKPRYRSPQKVVQEIIDIYNSTGRMEFGIYDDTFTINKKHAEEICSLLKKSGINFKWRCMSTVKVRDVNFYLQLKSAGCNCIAFGIETGDSEALQKLGKNITVDEVKDAFKLAHKLGFFTRAFIMYGFPWEDKSHIDASISLLKEISPDSIGYSSAVPLPGTELFNLVRNAGFLNGPVDEIDWSHCHQYSPEMFFSSKVTRKEAYKLSLYAEKEFYLIDVGLKGRIIRKLKRIYRDRMLTKFRTLYRS